MWYNITIIVMIEMDTPRTSQWADGYSTLAQLICKYIYIYIYIYLHLNI